MVWSGSVMEEIRKDDRVYVPTEKRPYRVRCRSERFAICTKPYNPRRTVMYFIADFQEKIRGPDNQIFCCGYETDEQCEERLRELEAGEIEVSFRNRVPLDIEKERKVAKNAEA